MKYKTAMKLLSLSCMVVALLVMWKNGITNSVLFFIMFELYFANEAKCD